MRTLIVVASEFSRDMIIEGKDKSRVREQSRVPEKIEDPKFYGMHRHFTDAGCVLMFGGGIKKGNLYGETAPERPCTTIKDPIHIEDLHATILHLMGIDHERLTYRYSGRDYRLTDVAGNVVRDILA